MTDPVPLAPASVASAPPLAEIAARTVDAVKTYGGGDAAVTALRGVSADFERGRFTAIMGASGSGKSTLLHCLAGLDQLTSGQVYIGGVELTALSDRNLTLLRREKVGFIFQAYNLVPTLRAIDNITLPMALAGRTPDRAFLDTIVKTLGLGERLRHRPNALSGGQQQRVAAARALLSKPEIIFADEPTGNLDSQSGAELLKFLATAVREMGQTIVMVTHDPVAAASADRVMFLADGAVVEQLDAPSTTRILDVMRRMGR